MKVAGGVHLCHWTKSNIQPIIQVWKHKNILRNNIYLQVLLRACVHMC